MSHKIQRPVSQQTIEKTLSFSVCLLLLLLSIDVEAISAQTKKKKPTKQTEEQTLITGDGWSIPIVYYNSTEGKEAPVILLLHDRKQSRNVWSKKNGLARALQDQGYAVIAMDLRYHGDSKYGMQDFEKKRNEGKFSKRDYAAMVFQDIETVKGFIFKKHQEKSLNMRKMGIVGIGMSGPLAIAFTAYDWSKPPFKDGATLEQRTPRGQDVRSLVLISSDKYVTGMNTMKQLRVLSRYSANMKILIQFGNKDTENPAVGKIAKDFYQRLGGKKSADRKVLYLVEYDSRHRGAELLEDNKDAKTNFTVFFEKSLKHLNGPNDEWKDRRNRFLRDD